MPSFKYDLQLQRKWIRTFLYTEEEKKQQPKIIYYYIDWRCQAIGDIKMFSFSNLCVCVFNVYAQLWLRWNGKSIENSRIHEAYKFRTKSKLLLEMTFKD